MMRSMYSGVSGLRIHQTKMDVIGNNIANVNTPAFKSSRVTFNEIFSQTLQGASGPSADSPGVNPMQIGLGANVSSIDTLMTEGAAQRTDNPLDIKIEGDGFFVVKDASGYKYTRAGAFYVDEAGTLAYNGMHVMGWSPDSDGVIQKSKVDKIDILGPENLYSEPDKTTNMNISGNIDITDPALKTANGHTILAKFYDSLGYTYTAEISIKYDATNHEYDFTFPADSIKDEDGNTITNDQFDVGVEFTADGKIDLDAAKWAGSPGIGIEQITGLSKANYNGEIGPTIDIDFTTLTFYNSGMSVEASRGDLEVLGGGAQAGSISGYEVGGDGKVLARYTNGKTKLLGQVIVTTFKNPAGLQKVGGNLFDVTTNSGDFDGIGKDITAIGGKLNGGVLEMSNVDLSREFTDMITTQRGFQANSRIITSSDEMLQELVNLKR